MKLKNAVKLENRSRLLWLFMALTMSCQGLVGGLGGSGASAPGSGSNPAMPTQPSSNPSQPGMPPVLPNDGEPCVANDLTLRRLTNAEFNNTASALFAISTPFANQLPQGISGGVFDNNRRAQSLDVTTVTKYLYEVVEPLVDAVLEREKQAADKRVLTCDLATSGCLRQILSQVGLRAWRRPLLSPELDALEKIAAESATLNEPPLEGVRWALVDLLLSPHFWFRIEAGAQPDAALDAFALATRLSFFLSGSSPDDALLTSASSGALSTANGFEQQVNRLLQDAKASQHWSRSMAAQWFGATTAAPPTLDANRYPAYVEATGSMRDETEGLLKYVFENNADINDLVSGSYSFGDEKTRKFYQQNSGAGLQKIELPAGRGAGLLTQPLLVSSNHGLANPIFRGAWVLKRLMCLELKVPQNVPALPAETVASDLPLAERLKKHRTSPSCASCHDAIDPVGLAMEDLGPSAQPRTAYDDGKTVNAASTLPSGAKVNGVRQLGEFLKTSGEFVDCSTKRVASFAYGVPLTSLGTAQVAALRKALGTQTVTVPGLLRAVANEASFKTVCGAQAR